MKVLLFSQLSTVCNSSLIRLNIIRIRLQAQTVFVFFTFSRRQVPGFLSQIGMHHDAYSFKQLIL